MDSFQFIADHLDLVMLATVPFFIAGQVWFLVRRMSEPENMFQELPSPLDPAREQAVSRYHEWLAANDFFHVITYKFGAIQSVTFQQRNSQRFFSFYFHARLTFSIETYFDDDTCGCLDTGTSGSIGMFPRRQHQYQQSFPNATPEEAWKRHLGGEQYVMEKFGIKCRPLTMPYKQVLLKALRLRMIFVRSIPFYPFRALYWFVVMRLRMANRSVQQQFP